MAIETFKNPTSPKAMKFKDGCSHSRTLAGSGMLVTADSLNKGGAKRMANRLRKHGMSAKYGKCPQCGGKIEAADNKNICMPSSRYEIGCVDDCEMVIAPSVPKLMETWKSLFPNNVDRRCEPDANE